MWGERLLVSVGARVRETAMKHHVEFCAESAGDR